ncbi:MAG: VgrG-related protein [Spirillospora sp.]
MPGNNYTNEIQVTIKGRRLTPEMEAKLVEAWVDTSVNLPAAFQLTFRDPRQVLLKDLGAELGAEVELSALVVGKGAGTPLFTGEVTALEADFDRTGKYTIVRGYDPGHRLVRNRRVKGFKDMTASDIARVVAKASKVTVGTIDRTRVKYDMITQANISDWDFLSGLAQENGVELFFDPKGKFQFVNPKAASRAPGKRATPESSSFVLRFGDNLLRLRTGVTASDQVSTVQVRGWDPKTQRDIAEEAPAVKSSELSIGATGAAVTKAFGKAEQVETQVPYETRALAKEAAKSLAADVGSALAELEAEVRGDPKLLPGVPVAVNGVGSPFEGKYTVTSARHMFMTGEQYVTRLTVSGRDDRSLFGLASGGSATSAPRVPGVVTAVVTENDKEGRVKLRFPWLDKTYVSDWARVMQFGGKGGGGVLMPQVKDEVLVAFDRGLLDHPYVIGGLYNGVHRLPTYQKLALTGSLGKVNWQSVASRKGNRIELLDAPGQQGVTISSGNDRLSIKLEQAKRELSVTSAGGVKISGVNDRLNIEMDKARSRLSVSSAGDVKISGVRAVNVTGAVVTVSAASRIDLRAPTIGITGMVQLQGNLNVNGLITQNFKPVMVIP